MPTPRDPTELEPRPEPPPRPGPGSTTSQLRRDIESGATGDKVPMMDPAASPLGTDDEAAGAPPSPETVTAARIAERVPTPPSSHAFDHGGPRLGMVVLSVLVVLVLLGLLALAVD